MTDFLPPLPETDHEEGQSPLERAFNWYKHVALLLNCAASIDPRSPAAVARPDVYLNVLRGLLNRCARLATAMLKISTDGRGGEVVMILARCTIESAVNGCWLISGHDQGAFRRYLANGLTSESKFCDLVRENIDDRGGDTWVVERRMLDFEECAYDLAGMSREEVEETQKLPDFNSRLANLKYGDLAYAALYRTGSHSVHGTWLDLIDHYLDTDTEGSLLPVRDSDVLINDKHYLACSLLLLEFLRQYLLFMLGKCGEREGFLARIRLVEDEVLSGFHESNANDYIVTDSDS